MEELLSFGSLELGHLRKEKKKKNSRKDKIQPKDDVKTDKNNQKKKKNKSLEITEVEVMDGGREKKKEKHKKKKRLALELDDSLMFIQGTSAHANPPVKTEASNPKCSNTLENDKDCEKKIKRKKKVAFDLSPSYSWAKRPKIVPSQYSPKESILEKNAVRHSEICSQATGTRYNQAQTHVSESQCTAEDINSQDLFITQKTFGVSSSEPSSGEASDKAVNSSPQMFTPRDKLNTSAVWIKHPLEGPHKRPRTSRFQHRRTTNERTQKTVDALLLEEEEWLIKAFQSPKKVSVQTQTHLNANLSEDKKASGPAHKTPGLVKAYLGEPLVKSSPDVAKSMKHDHILSEQSSSRLSVSSTSTQTEHFFTTELCSYLNFCQRSRTKVHPEDLKPLDLSLPQRTRGELGICVSVKNLSLPGGNKDKEPNLHPYCYLDMKDVEVESESEPYNVDKTTSSEDEPHCCTGKQERTQVKTVQMRLNESFFFKTKGEGKSPRPESPLMKLNQGREVKSRKVV